jgi:hypothetical protein
MYDADDTFIDTWSERRKREAQGWIGWHLAVLSNVQPRDLENPDALRALQTHATSIAQLAEQLGRLSGDEVDVEQLVAAFRAQLDELG